MAGFFKPLADCGSHGVFKCELGDSKCNPLKGQTNPLSLKPQVEALAKSYEELLPYIDASLVGLVEEYISPSDRVTVSIDGFVAHGQIHHYCISENIYKDDTPEEFDCLLTPARLRGDVAERCWALYNKVATDLVLRGLDNQFLDVEAFILPGDRVEVMEVNCRTFSNQLPVFCMLFGRTGDMFSAALDLLQDKLPPFTTPPDPEGACGICVYKDKVPCAPSHIVSDDGDCIYYSSSPAFKAHVYATGHGDLDTVRSKAENFYDQIIRSN
jgi:hypothetical protein